MKRETKAFLIVILATAALSGCSDSRIQTDAMPDVSIETAVVSKAELVDALWDLNEEPLPDADCVANSSFKIYPTDGFEILKNASKTVENAADAVIVGSVNISFTDEGNDGRSDKCAMGDLHYTVSASEESPISIVSSLQLMARHSVSNIARSVPKDYPGCTIIARFEKAGAKVCEDDTEDEDKSEAESEEETQDSNQAEEEQVADNDSADQDDDSAENDDDNTADDNADDDTANDDDGDDDNTVIVVPGIVKPTTPIVTGRGFKALRVGAGARRKA